MQSYYFIDSVSLEQCKILKTLCARYSFVRIIGRGSMHLVSFLSNTTGDGFRYRRLQNETTRGNLSCPVALYRETTLETYKSSKPLHVWVILDQKSHKKRHENVYLHEQEPIWNALLRCNVHSIEEEKTVEINFLHPIGYFERNCDKSFPNIYQYLTKEWVMKNVRFVVRFSQLHL